ASRADGTILTNSGQVRLQTETGDDKIIVVDFGMLRTVSGVGRVVGAPSLTICYLQAFRGDAFASDQLYRENCFTGIGPAFIPTAEQNTFETRTDRVRLKVRSSASLTTIANNLWLQFPDLP